MGLLDSRTLLLVLSVGNVVLALLLLAFDQSNRLTRSGRIWAAAKFLEGIGFLCLGLRGEVDDFLSIPIANSLLFGGFVAEFAAARHYLRLGARWNLVLAVAALLLAAFWIAYLTGMPEAQRVTVFAVMAIAIFACTSAAYATRWRQATPLGRAFTLSYILLLIAAIARAAVSATGAGYTLLANVSAQTMTYGTLFLFMVLNGFGFLMLAQEDVARQLRRSQERLLHARRLTRVASAELDLKTGLPVWSSGIIELLGFPPGHALPDWESYRALIHPDDRAKVDDSVETARRGEPLKPDEYRIKGGDGKWRWLRREAELLPGNRVLVTLQDVTERVRMENDLRQGYASLERAQRMGKIGSAEIDLTTMIVTWSDELYEIFARDRAAGPADLGQFLAYIHPDDRAMVVEIREQYLRGNTAGSHEFRIVRDDGSIRWIHREAEQIHDEKGRPIRLITAEQDVTERVQMETELLHGRDRLIQAQRIGRMGSAEFDLRKGSVLRSDEYHRLLGLDPGRGPYGPDAIVAAMHPDDQETVRIIIAKMLAGEDNPPIDLRAVHPDGSTVWLKRHQEFVRDDDGRKLLAIVTLQDITALKELDQAKDEFIATVSHELRTPLTSIRGALALAAASAPKDLNEKIKHLIDVAHRNSERLARLVDDLLDVQRIQAGRMIYHLSEVTVTQLVEEAIEANRPLGAKAGIEIRLVAGLAGARVRADSERLMQVMANLFSNAVKFSKSGQTVDVSIEREAPWIRITVADHGEGIPEAFRDKMFKRFSQLDASNTRKRGGSGLGLSIVEAIVAFHEGRVSFDSQVGIGTRFYIDLKELTGDSAGTVAQQVAAD